MVRVPPQSEPQDPEILKQIHGAEIRVEQMTVQAMADAQRLLEQAREEAERRLAQRRTQIEQAVAARRQEQMGVVEQECRRIVQQAGEEAERLSASASAKLDPAAEFVLRELFPELGGDRAA